MAPVMGDIYSSPDHQPPPSVSIVPAGCNFWIDHWSPARCNGETIVGRHWLLFLLVLASVAVFGKDQLKNVRIEIRLDQSLGSDISHDGESFTGSLNRQVSLGPNVVLPKGSVVQGVVKNAESTMDYYRPGILELELTSVSTGGKTYQISTNTLRLMGKERRMDPTNGGKQDDRGARRDDAIRAAGAVLGGTNSTAQTIPGTSIAVGTSDRVTGMQVVLPQNSKLTFTVTTSE